MTRKVDKGDQPSGGEMTWTNTEATRSGKGQDKVIWRRHAEAFAQTTGHNGCLMMMNDDLVKINKD